MAAAPLALKEKGNACYALRQFEQAASWYSRAIELSPDSPALFTNRAAALAELRKWPEALADAEASLRLDARWVKGLYRAGVTLLELKRAAEAVAMFERGVAADPLNRQMQEGLERACAALLEVPADAADARARGNAAYRDGHYEKAAEWYTLGLELRAEGEEGDALAAALYANRAECARQLGVPREVVADCSAALRLAPRHEKALLRRAAALEATERFAAAAEDYEALAALGGAGERAAREGARRTRRAAAAC